MIKKYFKSVCWVAQDFYWLAIDWVFISANWLKKRLSDNITREVAKTVVAAVGTVAIVTFLLIIII